MSTPHTDIDPVTLEVVRNRLDSIVREMGDVILRTARSSVAHHGRDFSCGIFNRDAEMLAIGTSMAIHTVPLMFLLRGVLRRFRGEIKPGDIFVVNDPWEGGLHPNDIAIAVPVFYQAELVAFSCTRLHHYDVGGIVPGSISGNSSEIHQEGLLIPLMRLGRDNVIDPNVLELILHNVRVPHEMRGDLMAQLASCRVGARRLTEIMDRYGKEDALFIWAEVLNAYERRCRALIGQLPQTTLVHESYMDSDGVDPGHLRIRVAVTTKGDSVTVDFTGSSPQTAGSMNVTLPLGVSFGLMGVKAALDPSGPVNSGYFRPIDVIVPEGSLLNVRRPSSAAGQDQLGQAAILTMGAMSKLVQDRVSAEEGSSTHHMTCAGTDLRFSEPRRFIFYESLPGGGGARSHKDGLDNVRPIRSGNGNVRGTEVLERNFPLLFTKNHFRQNSGGSGRFRGGLGSVREFRMSSDGIYSVLGDHAIVPPAGSFGGYSGATSSFDVVRDGETIHMSPKFGSKATAFPLKKGDLVRIYSQGGGGWGDPLERDMERVFVDVLDGRCSVEQARDVYGVILDPQNSTVDVAATQQARAALPEQRVYLEARRGGPPEFQGGVRLGRISPTLAQRESNRAGDLADVFVPGHSNPVRLRIDVQDGLPDDALLLDEETWLHLELESGQRVLWRGITAGT